MLSLLFDRSLQSRRLESIVDYIDKAVEDLGKLLAAKPGQVTEPPPAPMPAELDQGRKAAAIPSTEPPADSSVPSQHAQQGRADGETAKSMAGQAQAASLTWDEAVSEDEDFPSLSQEGISLEEARARGLIDDDVLARLLKGEEGVES